MIQIATLVVSCLALAAHVAVISLLIRSGRENRKVNWLKNFAQEGLALAQHSKAHHKANNRAFSARDEEDEAVRWVLDRAKDLKIPCSRQQAARLVAIVGRS